MAHYYDEPSRTFSEYLLIPGFTDSVNTPDRVDLSTPLTKFGPGVEEPFIKMNIQVDETFAVLFLQHPGNAPEPCTDLLIIIFASFFVHPTFRTIDHQILHCHGAVLARTLPLTLQSLHQMIVVLNLHERL